MNKKSSNKIIFIGIAVVMVLVGILVVSLGIKSGSSSTNLSTDKTNSLEEMINNINVNENTPVKASVALDDTSLYDELPEIDKYPLVVKGDGGIDLEVFSSGEKAGNDYESWLIDVANKFNKSGVTTSDGKSVSVSIRQVSSGLGADYIISNKYLPDLYTPSNILFGEYASSQGGSLTLYNKRLVGNTTGVLISKSKDYKSFDDIVNAVKSNEINLGYTNPQTSASGLNFLLTLLNMSDSSDMFGDTASKAFSDFQNNIPFVAYTTMQMRDSASNGSLDGMVMEYQTYINEKDLSSVYNFIPYGVRHDNPLYTTSKAVGKEEAVKLFNDFCMSDDMQKIAKDKGFNNNDDYKSDLDFSGSEVSKALSLYKKNKDSGKDVIAVFVADCSGSMDGEPINQLRDSLTNGAKYINDNNLIGFVSYSSDVTIELPIAKFDLNQRAYFQGAIENLQANGGTASYDALLVALDMIKKAKVDNPDAKTMLFLLSDGQANGGYTFDQAKGVLQSEGIPVYTISYTDSADTEAMKEISNVNEAASINADSDDVVYKIKSLFNSQM